MKKYVIISIVLMFVLAFSDLMANKYAVYFKDKNNSPYSVDNPEVFLSERSIARRQRLSIETTVQDLPVNPEYVQAIVNAGANVIHTSRWLNCAIVTCSQSIATQLSELDCVKEIVYIAPGNKEGESRFKNKLKSVDPMQTITDFSRENYQYGQGYTQINQINGIPVHQQGYTGVGVLIAVLDGGFSNVNNINAFSRLFNENRIILTRDIVNPGGDVYSSNTSDHGTAVLSCIASYLPNQFIGTAPEASFALIRTEDGSSEYLIESYNWVVGAELADSIGADLITTSLGYSEFDDSSMNYIHNELDGNTAPSSIAAVVATQKGIFVTASAGNSNGTSFPWVNTPADANEVCTVGAVRSNGTIAYFSSIGPNGAGEPKPDVLALGVSATVISEYGTVSTASGTSFSCPITAGMIACLLQANPTIMPTIILDIINQTGNRYPNHDDSYGYGIPDYTEALQNILIISDLELKNPVINDLEGNNNGKLNPGETAIVNLSIHNKIDSAFNDVSVYFVSEDTLLTVISDTVNLGNFSSLETKTFENIFTISLSENATPNSNAKVKAYFYYNDKTTIAHLDIMIYNHDIKYYGLDIINDDNNDGILNPGETADIYLYLINAGNDNVNGVTGLLSSTSEYITINSNNNSFGNINFGEIRYASYNVTLSEEAVQDELNIPFVLHVNDVDNTLDRDINFNYSDKCQIIFNLFDAWGDGWNNAKLIVSFSDGAPNQILTVPTGQSSATYNIDVSDMVTVTLTWQSGAYDGECSFNVTYTDGSLIYETIGTPQPGILYTFDVSCGGDVPDICFAPINLIAEVQNEENIALNWEMPEDAIPVSYNIYRNNLLIDSTTTNLYIDENVDAGENCYNVEAIYEDGCVSEFSNTSCASLSVSTILGDANNSYNVDGADIITVVNYIMEQNPSPFIFNNADVNADGVINIFDIFGIIFIIMNE